MPERLNALIKLKSQTQKQYLKQIYFRLTNAYDVDDCCIKHLTYFPIYSLR